MMAAVWCNVRDKGERRIRKGQRVPREDSEKVDVCGWKDLGVKCFMLQRARLATLLKNNMLGQGYSDVSM